MENNNDKVMVVGDKKYFKSPLDEEGKPYWIPIVVKDKSYLLGYMNAYMFISEVYEIDSNDLQVALSSDRFNDILMDGSRIKNLTRTELKTKLKKMFRVPIKEKHPENDESILDEFVLSISCAHCGMYYSWEKESDVPEEDVYCVTCGKALIIYTRHYDEYFNFEGKSGMVDKILEEINEEDE